MTRPILPLRTVWIPTHTFFPEVSTIGAFHDSVHLIEANSGSEANSADTEVLAPGHPTDATAIWVLVGVNGNEQLGQRLAIMGA